MLTGGGQQEVGMKNQKNQKKASEPEAEETFYCMSFTLLLFFSFFFPVVDTGSQAP